MDKSLNKIKRQFIAVTIFVALAVGAVGSLGAYLFTNNQLTRQVDAATIADMAERDPIVSEYLASQKPYHAHFESIVSYVQADDISQITSSLPLIIAMTFLVAAGAGWLLAQWLLRPVQESYVAQVRFMQDAAHELRNPLAAMSSQIQQSLRSKSTTPAQTRQALESMSRQINHLSAITTDLLILERKATRGTKSVNVSDLLEDVIEELYHTASERNLVIKHDIEQNVMTEIDAEHFVLIARNLIENAIKFTKSPKKPVEVSLKKRQHGFELEVKDYGIGIADEERQKITQRFYRAKNANETEGTGLGMAIVAKFIELYKGALDIQSTPGKGTTMSVRL
jgi:signal transduction histidine kinase